MPWCPKCKSEYESDIETCAECNIQLVENFEDAILYKKLMVIDENEVERIVAYLSYSNIQDIKEEKVDNGVLLSVPEKVYSEAINYLKVFLREETMDQEEETSFYIDEYKTEIVDGSDDKINEMKSSYVSLIIIGSGITLFGILHIIGIMTIVTNPIFPYVAVIIGVFFIGLGIMTARQMPTVQSNLKKSKQNIEHLVKWYEETGAYKDFYEKRQINKENINEGALYFITIDAIKADLKKGFPNINESVLNSAAEEIIDQWL